MNDLDIIILCGGKSGSTTLYDTMKYYKYKCIKVHGELDFIKQFNYNGLFKTIDYSSKHKELFIIDSYRTPIERSISSFFENIHIYVPDYRYLSIDSLIDIFNERFINNENYNSIDLVMEHYNIPKFKKFDFSKGYIMKKHNNIVFVKLLFKDISNWDIILSKIFCRHIVIFPNNLSDSKEYYDIYKKFKSRYKLPLSYIKILEKDEDFEIYNEISVDSYIKKFNII